MAAIVVSGSGKAFVPLAEDQVGAYQQAASFIALGQEGKEDLHFLAALLHET
jgi:hypothetical protein